MVITTVCLSSNSFLAISTHSLVTEKEEIMGLLLGTVEKDLVKICDICLLPRNAAKHADRVEIGAADVAEATGQADRASASLGRSVRVVGWYHSHPHITPRPSHVDLQCQLSYQGMDSSFVGVICSVFGRPDASNTSSLSLHAFRSSEKLNEVPLSIYISPPELNIGGETRLASLAHVLMREQIDNTQHNTNNQDDLSSITSRQFMFAKLLYEFCVPTYRCLCQENEAMKEELSKLKTEEEQLEKQIQKMGGNPSNDTNDDSDEDLIFI